MASKRGSSFPRLLPKLLLPAAVHLLRRASAAGEARGPRTSTPRPERQAGGLDCGCIYSRAMAERAVLSFAATAGLRDGLWTGARNHRVDFVFGLGRRNKRLLKIIGRELHLAQQEFQARPSSAAVQDFEYRTKQELEPPTPRRRQSRASGEGEQPAVRRHELVRGTLRDAALYEDLYCAWRRDGEPHQGTAVVLVRRPHQLPDDARISCGSGCRARPMFCCLDAATTRLERHAAGRRAVATPIPPQTAQDRRHCPRQRPPRLVLAGSQLSVSTTLPASLG